LFNPLLEQCGQSDQPTGKLNKGLDLLRLSLTSVDPFGHCFVRNVAGLTPMAYTYLYSRDCACCDPVFRVGWEPLCSPAEHFWHVYVLGAAYFVWPWKSYVPWYRDVTAGTLTATDTYALRMHMCGRG
jgi:hypothetical protein